MKTFREFIAEVYDPDVVGKSQIRKQGEGGRVGRMRKQTEPEKKRMKAAGGKMVPAKTYKSRKDIGTQRKTSDRQQQPTQDRGSAREKQLAAAKAERKRAAQARAGKVTKLPSQATSKPKPKALKKSADKLLATKKKKTVDPNYKPQKASGYTRDERHRLRNAARRVVKDIQTGKDKNRPLSYYDPRIKNFGRDTGTGYSNEGMPSKKKK